MGVFGPTVSREMYEDMKRARDLWQQECSALRMELTATVKEILAVKRHDLGMPPAGFTATDPLEKLGKLTKAAANEMSMGSASLQSHMVNWALTQWDKATAEGERTPDELDRMIAHAIREGDAG